MVLSSSKTCKQCGVTFARPLRTSAKTFEARKFCSPSCTSKGKSSTQVPRVNVATEPDPDDRRICEQCDKAFYRNGYPRKAWSTRRFCGKLCLADARSQGKTQKGAKP